jgi:hypothetical protein
MCEAHWIFAEILPRDRLGHCLMGPTMRGMMWDFLYDITNDTNVNRNCSFDLAPLSFINSWWKYCGAPL